MTDTPTNERCVCGDPIELQDPRDPNSWIHSPGSDTPCLNAHRVRPPAVEPPVDRAALRQRAEAALAAVEAALGDTLLPAAREEALAGIVAVLPEPADQAPSIPPKADTAAGDESPHIYMTAIRQQAAHAHAFTKAGRMPEALEHVEAIERLLVVYRRAVGVQGEVTS